MLLPVIFIKTPSETSSSSSSVVVVKKREPSRRPPFSRTPPLLGLRFCCCPTISAAYHVERLLFLLLSVFVTVNAFSIRDFMVNRSGNKRTAAEGGTELVQCPTWHPFQCPSGDCVPIKYLCDGSPDCSDEYDENTSMCTAAIRPPVEETSAFLRALMNAHGNDFLVKVFGSKAKNGLEGLGGVDRVAITLSESPTVETFASEMGLDLEETSFMANILQAIISGARSDLSANEAADFRFFVEKLQETGFF